MEVTSLHQIIAGPAFSTEFSISPSFPLYCLLKLSINYRARDERVSSYSTFEFHPLSGYKTSSEIPSTDSGTSKLKYLKV